MSVYKRNNRWYYYIKIRGARYRGAIPEARVKSQAMEAERKIRDQIFEGKYQTAQSKKASEKTLKEFVEGTYLPWARDAKRSWRNDQSRSKPILAHFGKMRLSEITPFDVERFKIARSKSKIIMGKDEPKERIRSKASVNREIALLSRIFSLAVSKKEVSSNPVKGVRFLKGEVRRKRYLLPEEEERLMAKITGHQLHLRLIVIVALNTGMRLREILKLRKTDVDFGREEILVTQTKTDKDRIIPMNETLRTELFNHISRLELEYLFANPKTGKPMVSVQRTFDTARRKAKIEDFRFHDLRHTAATRMGEAGIDPFTIAAILGHSKIDMTVSYTHATEAAKRRAVAALGEANEKQGHKVGHNPLSVMRLAGAK
ncbi:MAG: site-specific integrase [Acidobacteriota bacterium]